KNSTGPVWTRVSSKFYQQSQSWPTLPAAVLALALSSTNPAGAASIVVDNPGDSHVDGKTSLRESIQRSATLDDTITFAPRIIKISLRNRELAIERGVTITALDLVAVMAQPGHRVFNISSTGQAFIFGLYI